jgi:SNF2 family DNA or RNA helicase
VDAYGLAKLVNPKGVPPFFGQYRDSVMNKITTFKWAPKPTANQTVHKALQPAIRFEKAQCLDLPPVTFADRDAPLTLQQKAYYIMLVKELLIEAAGEEVSAVNAAAKTNKLLQISGGAVYTDQGEVLEFDVSNRLNVVQEIIDECSHKVLVFVPFTHTIELLKRHLEKSKIPCEVINGSVPVNRRSDIVKDFQETDKIKVLIIQPQAASHGLTLTAADTIIWYAPCSSVETYLQANARIDRPGQVNPMTIHHIMGSSAERKMYSMLRGNVNSHQKIIDLYRQILDDTP